MLSINATQTYPVVLRASRKNDKYFVIAMNGVATHRINKYDGTSKAIKLGPRDKRALTTAGVKLSGDYVAQS